MTFIIVAAFILKYVCVRWIGRKYHDTSTTLQPKHDCVMNTIWSVTDYLNGTLCAHDFYDDGPDDRTEQTFGTGEMIFTEGSPIIGVYCVRTGRAAVLKRQTGGDNHITTVAPPGTILGVPGVFMGENYLNSVIALEPTSVCFVPKKTFLRVAARHPEIVSRAIAQIADRIMLLERHLDNLLAA